MASGVYQLEFATGQRYIGKSVDMQQRWKQHADKLQKGTAAKAMQGAYHQSKYELPQGQVLLECHPDMLDEYEGMYINLYTPELNTSIPGRRSEVEYGWLQEHAAEGMAVYGTPLLCHSLVTRHAESMGYMGRVEELTTELGALQDGWDSKVAIEAAAIEGHEELLIERINLNREVRELGKLCNSLGSWKQQVKKLGWWSRLWANWPV